MNYSTYHLKACIITDELLHEEQLLYTHFRIKDYLISGELVRVGIFEFQKKKPENFQGSKRIYDSLIKRFIEGYNVLLIEDDKSIIPKSLKKNSPREIKTLKEQVSNEKFSTYLINLEAPKSISVIRKGEFNESILELIITDYFKELIKTYKQQ